MFPYYLPTYSSLEYTSVEITTMLPDARSLLVGSRYDLRVPDRLKDRRP